mgnify:CR=1 FL=1
MANHKAPKQKVTNQEIKMNFKGHDIVIPKGTRTTHQTACGIDENYNFISDLSWIKPHIIDGKEVKNYGLIHDATFYGINIPKNQVEEIK